MRILPVLLSMALLAGCAGVDEDPTKDWGPEQFYDEARERMADGDYETAIKLFEQLEARFPYGRYAEQAQIEVAYAYFKHDEPALAVAAVDRFLRLHPTHPNADYAYYLKGVVNFKGERGIIATLVGASDDPMEHDPKALREAYQAFTEVITRFPNSRYAADSAARREFLFDAQGRYEIYVARYYCDRGAYVACLNRARYALETYPRTTATEAALGLSALAYKKLGINDLMDDTLRVLRLNFPTSAYLREIADADKASAAANNADAN
jgi:outer membrane protein assembly factor BamD